MGYAARDTVKKRPVAQATVGNYAAQVDTTGMTDEEKSTFGVGKPKPRKALTWWEKLLGVRRP